MTSRTLIFFTLLVLLCSTVISFESERSDDETIDISEEIQCWNNEDNSLDGNAPPGGNPDTIGKGPHDVTPGCVNPYWEDDNEAMIWGQYLMSEIDGMSYSTVDEEAESSPDLSSNMAFFHEGGIIENQELNPDQSSGSSITVHWVDAVRDEQTGLWGFGIHREDTYSQSDFDTFTGEDGSTQQVEIRNNRVIDTPHDNTNVCGNGMEDLDISKIGNDAGDEYAETDCKGDYGEIKEIYDRREPYGSYYCEQDYGPIEETVDEDCDCDTGSTTGCGGCSSGDCRNAECWADIEVYCDVEEDNSAQESNYYYRPDGDFIVYNGCEDTGGPLAEYEDSCEVSQGGEGSCNWNTGQYCDIPGSCYSSGDSDYDDDDCTEGTTDRDWIGEVVKDCNDNNHVNGGGIDGTGNDPAGTYTKFTAHSDSSWGSASMSGGDSRSDGTEDGSVWCGYDETLTVNADGPEGNGNGFIVIDERAGTGSDAVVARESPDGSNRVGRNVHYGATGSATTVDSNDYLDSVGLDLSCSGSTRVCIKYVDFYTGTSGWSTVPGAVEGREVYEGLPSDSYSVCKNINHINERNGDSRGDDLIDCDYMRNGDNISPLPEACGDQDEEHVMVMEGSPVDSGTAEQWLGHEQACVSWGGGEQDFNGRTIDSSACVNQGQPWAEGTVLNVASENFVNSDFPEREYPYTDEGWEEGGDSPDWQVCLDIGDYASQDAPKPYNHRHNDPSNERFGGQWYDLDDDRIHDYLRDMEANGLINSESAGDSSANNAGGNEAYTWIDYYYTENPNPQHDDYNPKGGLTGTALVADCGPNILCGDEGNSDRTGVSAPGYGEGVYFGFSQPGSNTFDTWSRDDDYHPQGMWSRDFNDEIGEDYSIISDGPEESRQNTGSGMHSLEPRDQYTGYLVRAESVSNQLADGNPDYNGQNWWFNTYVDEDRAVQYGFAEGPDWGVDSTGVLYPPGGISESGDYLISSDSSAGNHRHIDYQNPPRTNWEEGSISKTDKAHGNSVLVVANDNNDHGYEQGQAYWIDPDDIFNEWQNDNIERDYWR